MIMVFFSLLVREVEKRCSSVSECQARHLHGETALFHTRVFNNPKHRIHQISLPER